MELEAKVSRAQVIDVASLSGDRVKFGATVVLADEDTDVESTYRIVGTMKLRLNRGRLSITAPLARALLNKTVGDSVEVTTPGGLKSYEIISVTFIKPDFMGVLVPVFFTEIFLATPTRLWTSSPPERITDHHLTSDSHSGGSIGCAFSTLI